MSNIFKRLRLIGRREEREEMNRDGEAHLQNDSGLSATENAPEQNPSNARGDFRHHRPRCRRSARKRLRFPSKHESEPALSCRKIVQEEIPHASHPDASRDDTESCDAVPLKDNVADNETGGTEGRDCSTDGIESKTTTKGEDDLNESFEVLMPDLLSSNGDDLLTKKITQECNEATPDPPVLHRMDTVPGLPSVRKDTSPGLISVSKEDVNVPIKSPVNRAQVRKEDFHLLKLLCSDEDTIHCDSLPLLSLSKEKRHQQAFTLGKEVGHASLKVKDVQGESYSKKNFVMIERNDLNTPLGESNLNASNISLTLSRSSSRRKQEFNKIKECNDQGATVLESHKDVNKDFARIDEEQGSRSNKENIEDVKVKQCNDQGVTVLESHKEVNKDISRIDGEKVRFVSNKENNENAKAKQCNEKGATVLESHKDLNKDFAKIDEKNLSGLNKENNENVKNTECNNEEMMVPELKSQRVSEDCNKDIARNNVEQHGSGSNKENTAYVKVKECNDEEAMDPELKSQRVGKILSKEENENSNDIIDFQNQSSKPRESTEAGIKSDEQDLKCSQSDTKLSAAIQETQSYKGNYKEITSCQKQLKPTESTKIEDRPERGDCESRESKELEGEGIDRLQSKKGNSHAEGTEEASKQEKREPIKLTKNDEGCKEEDMISLDSSAIPVESVEVIQYQEEMNDRDHKKELNGHTSTESTGDVFIHVGVKQMLQEKEHHTKELSCQELTQSTEVETKSAERLNEMLETGKEGNVNGLQLKEDESVEETKLSKDQPITKTTESPKVENRSGERGSQETNTSEIHVQVGGSDEVPQQSGEPGGLKKTEPVKSVEVESRMNREATFQCQPFKVTGPQDAHITTDLSPTITPRKMYEMFAAQNSQGNFNGSLPMADSSISQVPRKRGRPRKMKTEKQPKVKSVNRNNAYNMQMNNLEWSRMVSAPGSLHSQGDGMFMLANAMLQGQPQELNVAGGYYTNLLSSSEEMPFKSTDYIEGPRAASSSSGMDSQGTGQLEKDPSGNKATKEGDDGSGKVLNYSTQFNPVVQPYFDGLYMIDSAGGCFPVHPPYGPMIPPPGFQAGTFDPYGYPIPINGQYFPNQPDGRGTYLGADGTGTSTFSAEQNDSVNKIILDSSHSMKKGDAGGDQSVSDETNGQTLQDMTDINDALRILLGDAFDPSISDPGELLAMYGAELLKDDELRMEFIYFCEQLLNHEMMMSQPGCFYPCAYGDFTYPYPIPFNQPAMWPPPGPCPPGWYPNEVAYYYDGESYIPIGPVQLDPQGNPCMVLPLGHLDQYGQPQGAGDYMPIYATPDVTAGNTVSVEQFVQAGGNGIKEQSSFSVC